MKLDGPFPHAPTSSYRDSHHVEGLEEQVEELLGRNGGTPTIMKIDEFADLPGETYYAVTSKIKYESPKGKVIVANTSVFSKTGDKFSLRKDILDYVWNH
jgi:hypothetical protein